MPAAVAAFRGVPTAFLTEAMASPAAFASAALPGRLSVVSSISRVSLLISLMNPTGKLISSASPVRSRIASATAVSSSFSAMYCSAISVLSF